jgi:hypothetical protein
MSAAGKAAQEAAMQDLTTTPDPERIALAPIPARDLHPGDVLQQYDWPLHVCAVTLGPAAVTIAVTEFEFPLHYPADEPIQLVP